MSSKLARIAMLVAVLSLVMVAVAPVSSQSAGEIVPLIIVHSVTQAERPIEYETTRLVVENMRELGLEVEHRAIPWAQMLGETWYGRVETEMEDGTTQAPFQMTHWRMVGPPRAFGPR